jgi:hypothetical protein
MEVDQAIQARYGASKGNEKYWGVVKKGLVVSSVRDSQADSLILKCK